MKINGLGASKIEIVSHKSNLNGWVLEVRIFDTINMRSIYLNEAQVKVLASHINEQLKFVNHMNQGRVDSGLKNG